MSEFHWEALLNELSCLNQNDPNNYVTLIAHPAIISLMSLLQYCAISLLVTPKQWHYRRIVGPKIGLYKIHAYQIAQFAFMW